VQTLWSLVRPVSLPEGVSGFTTPTSDHGVKVAVDLFRHSEIEGVEDVYAEKEVGTEDLLLRP